MPYGFMHNPFSSAANAMQEVQLCLERADHVRTTVPSNRVSNLHAKGTVAFVKSVDKFSFTVALLVSGLRPNPADSRSVERLRWNRWAPAAKLCPRLDRRAF